MSRKVRNAAMESRTARQKLAAGKRHWMNLGTGLHLGYWRGAAPVGKWLMRRYLGEQNYKLETVAAADDIDDADGAVVLSFDQAQAKARAKHGERSRIAAGFPAKAGAPYTVADAVRTYLDSLARAARSSAGDARGRAESMILPALGHIPADLLCRADIEKWMDAMAKAPPRRRGKKDGEAQITLDGEAIRARKATANRTFTILRAALNASWRDQRIASNIAWATGLIAHAIEAGDSFIASGDASVDDTAAVHDHQAALRQLARQKLRSLGFGSEAATVHQAVAWSCAAAGCYNFTLGLDPQAASA
jgi:hypothetical protein